MKICNKCKKNGEFGPDKRNKDGLQGICRSCRRQEQRPRTIIWNSSDNAKKTKRKYNLEHKYLNAVFAAKYKSKKLNQMPSWISEKHIEDIKNIYRLKESMQLFAKEKLEVDHIIPLNGKEVKGLNVPWNLQILTTKQNRTKHNRA